MAFFAKPTFESYKALTKLSQISKLISKKYAEFFETQKILT